MIAPLIIEAGCIVAPMTQPKGAGLSNPLSLSPIIDTAEKLAEYLTSLGLHSSPNQRLYVDLEGVNLGRFGKLSLITIINEGKNVRTVLIDVTVLGQDAFSTSSTPVLRTHQTELNVGPSFISYNLKDVFESPLIKKVFFDVRNDSAALFHGHNVSVQGIEDLQLMELAQRRHRSKTRLAGLSSCIKYDSRITTAEQKRWQLVKNAGKSLFATGRGGSYAAFETRPLPGVLVDYSVQDVEFMPRLYDLYRAQIEKMPGRWNQVIKETETRVLMSQWSGLEAKDEDKGLAPVGF